MPAFSYLSHTTASMKRKTAEPVCPATELKTKFELLFYLNIS
jgi:hypothetical protein